MKAVIFGIVKCALFLQLAVIHASPYPQQTPYFYSASSYPSQTPQQSYLQQYKQLLSRQRQPYPSQSGAQYQYPVQGHVQHEYQHAPQQDYQHPVQQPQQDYQRPQQDYQRPQQDYQRPQQDYQTPVQGQQDPPVAPVQQGHQPQDQGNHVYQPPKQQDSAPDDRAQHYGGNGSPLIFIYPTEGDPMVVHDQKQRPPMNIFGSFSPQRPSGQQDPMPFPFFQLPTPQILAQPGPIRQIFDNVGNWIMPARQATTVLYPTTTTVLVPHFVTVTASCTAT